MAKDENLTLSKSKMMQYINAFDMQNINFGYNEYWLEAKKQPYLIWNNFYSDEIKFRESHFMNIVFSIEGTQGEGKSLFLLRSGEIISKAYGTKFNLDHIHFFPEDLSKDLANFKERTYYGQDEQPRVHGVMSNFIQDELSNYEDIYRKPQVNVGYASPSIRSHEHFFIFEACGDIYIDKNSGELSAVEVMLKTKRKSDGLIMPRGILRVSAPDKQLWKQYNQKKDDFIKKMGGEKGNRIKIIDDYAKATIEKFEEDLTQETDKGIKIASKDKIDFLITKTVGMGNMTQEGKTLVREEIKYLMQKKLM